MSDQSISYHWRGILGTLLLVLSLIALPIGIRYRIVDDSTTITLDFLLPVILRISDSGWEFMFPYSVLGIMIPILSILAILLVWYSVQSVQNEQKHSLLLWLLVLNTLLDFLIFFPTISPDRGSFPLPLVLIIGLFLYQFGLPKETDVVFEDGK